MSDARIPPSSSSPAAAPTPAPAPRKRRRWPWVVLGVVVVGVVAVGSGAAWVTTSTSGADWALRTGLKASGATGGFEGLSGTLKDGLTLQQLRVQHPSADVEVDALRVELDWSALWTGRVHVPVLSADRVSLNLKPSDTPSEPLTSLRLPVQVQADRVRIGMLQIAQEGTALPVSFADIDLQATLGENEHQLRITQLRALAPEAQASLRGQARIGVDKPFTTDIGVDIDGRQGDRAFTLRTDANGTLAALPFTLKGEGEGVALDATGSLALLDGFPLRGLRLALEGLDPAAWVPGAPKAKLDVSADLTVGTEGGKGPLLLRGPFSLTNGIPGPIDENALPLTRLAGQLTVPVETLASVQIGALQIALPGKGRIAGALSWKRGEQPGDAIGQVQGTLTATEIDASRLHGAALPTRLSGPITFEADAQRQQIKANLKEAGRAVPMSIALTAAIEDQLVKISQADVQAGEAKARATGELALQGDRKFKANVRLDRFDPSFFLPGSALPPALVSATVDAAGALSPEITGTAALRFDEGSRWNNAPLGGRVDAAFAGERLSRLDAAVTAGSNRLNAQGAFGRRGDRLTFDLDAPQLNLLWPSLRGTLSAQGGVADTLASPALDVRLKADGLQLPGGIRVDSVRGTADVGNIPATAAARGQTAGMDLSRAPVKLDVTVEGARMADRPDAALRKGTLVLNGTLANHTGRLDADFLQNGTAPPATVKGAFQGSWSNGGNARQPVGWRGTITEFASVRDPFGLTLSRPITVSYLPTAVAPAWQWEAGAADFAVKLPGGQMGKILHAGSRGGQGRWESAGRIEGLAFAPDLLMDAVSGKPVPPERIVIVDADWNVRFADALQGTAQIRRRSGDLWLPGTPPVALGLNALELNLQATPTGQPGRSRVTVKANVAGERLGTVRVDGEAGVRAVNGAIGLDADRPAFADADLDVKDLSWLGLLIGDTLELGGAVKGKVRIAQEGNTWGARGAITGDGIRVIQVDNGIRLLNGTLQARLEGNRIVLEALRFPGVIRVRPRDSRVTQWIDSEGQKSELVISADWNLAQASGHATIQADRFPAIQRADRFVAGSGRVDVDLAPTKLRVAGLFEVDAGWINLGTQSPPTLSDDVLVVRSGDEKREVPRGITFDVGLKLGERFFLQGYGLDTGLIGQIRAIGEGSSIRASGVVRTRGGVFSTYGQTLTVRRGAITFQGPIDDPLLDIVALRVGPAVEAGVQVAGTARRPRITLFSQPEVSDVEKLSWLLLGRGPDAGGGGADAGLLLSAATSLLGPKGGEPLTRRLGIDELGVRSGNVGSTRGLLPERTVAGNSTSATNTQLASQFFIIGKRITDTIYASFEQALSGRDGVVKLSYKLTDQLSVVGKGGTINGVDLLYMFMFND
ncbi:translocation/assembly module TamB domain-containing protein [Pigmentiphaga litoralis]|uniref:translocation/assembly module TamB domain-containing protein n=1 Tax=Pigmentiphaga litoralis TaxID=516702 RepID=UPI003B4361A0